MILFILILDGRTRTSGGIWYLGSGSAGRRPAINIRTTYKTRYGLDWPIDTHDVFIELTLGKKARLEPYCHGNLNTAGDHMMRAITSLFTNDQWNVNPWMESQVRAIADYDGAIFLGAASTGKSFTAGHMAVLFWITDPTTSYVALASTSVPMLRLRSWSAVVQCFRTLKKNPYFMIPGREAPSQTAIINSDDDGSDGSLKASVRGVALADGDQAKAIAKLAGVHAADGCMIILDEASALPPAAAKARFNAAAGTKRFVFVSLANPVSFTDEASTLAEPKDGWASIDENTPEWMSRYGFKVLHQNGFHSPAITEPDGEKKYPYLINGPQIERMLREVDGNDQDPLIWTMCRGFPSPLGLQNTVLSPGDVHTFGADKPVVWGDNARITRVAGLDPAFTSGGDAAILFPAEIGRMDNGLVGVHLLDPLRLPIDAGSQRPASYQVVDKAVEHCKELGIALDAVAIDDSGTQSVADIWKTETGKSPIRCNFAARAPGILPADTQKGAKGEIPKPRYANMVSELWSLMAKLVRQGRVRSLRGKCQAQFCSRMYKKDQKPLQLESKADYKKRSAGKSPDEADAAAVALLAAFRKGGMSLDGEAKQKSWLHKPMTHISTSIKSYVDSHMIRGYGEPRY